MRYNKKSAFTIVELVVVIAVIAVLAAVLIPTFSTVIESAKVSKDTQLLRNLNTALAVDHRTHLNMTEALEAASKAGYEIDRINASATDKEILWDSANDAFCYLDGSTLATGNANVTYLPEKTEFTVKPENVKPYQFWRIYSAVPAYAEQSFSIYMKAGATYTPEDGALKVQVGVDVGSNTGITAVSYVNTADKKDVVIRTNSAYTTLTVDAFVDSDDHTKGDTVNKFGDLGNLIVKKVAYGCYYENGKTSYAKADVGKVIAKDGGKIEMLFATSNAVVAREDGGTIVVAYCVSTDADEASESGYTNSSNGKGGNVIFQYKDENGNSYTESSIEEEGKVTVVESRTEETSQSETAKAIYGCMNAVTGKGYGIGEEGFREAVNEASENDTIIILNDFDVTSPIEFNKDVTLNFNGMTVTDKVQTNRAFKVYDATLKIDGANGKMVIDSNVHNSYGLIELRSVSGNTTGNEKLYINNLNMEGITCNAGLLTYRDSHQEMYLNQCNVKMTKPAGATKGGYGDNAAVVWGGQNGYELVLEVVGGTYEFDTADPARNVFNVRFSEVLINDAILATTVLPMEGAGTVGEAFRYSNCTVYNPTGNGWMSCAVSNSNGGTTVVDGGTYKADNCIETMSSAGIVTINGGAFEGKTNLILAYGSSYVGYGDPDSVITLNGGTFKGRITVNGLAASEAYVYIYGGTFTDCSFHLANVRSHVIVCGGTFDCDPSDYVDTDNYSVIVNDDTNPTLWTVVAK